MKKLILILVILFVTTAQGKDIADIVYRDSIEAADTNGAGTQTFDTSFSGWVKIDGAREINVFVRLVPNGDVIDTNFTSDTFFVNAQFSFDRVIIVKTVLLDTLLNDADVYTGADLLAVDSLQGDFMRAMLIHNTQKRPVASFTNVYGKILRFYYTLHK